MGPRRHNEDGGGERGTIRNSLMLATVGPVLMIFLNTFVPGSIKVTKLSEHYSTIGTGLRGKKATRHLRTYPRR